LGTIGLFTLLVPIIFGAAAQGVANPRPLVMIQPQYPPEALAAKREGIVELRFTIAANGTTKDVVVVESSAPEFEAPAVTALLRWRYSPTNVVCVGTDCRAIENAEPVERPGMRTVIRYQLEADNPRIAIETP
jgi:TonB family protein